MSIKDDLITRSDSVCELCEGTKDLSVYNIPPFAESADKSIYVCDICLGQITGASPMDANHWRCLNKSMWSSVPAVQIMVWRLLTALRQEGWPQNLLDMIYLDDEVLAWAKGSGEQGDTTSEEKVVHKDSNGAVLMAGDAVVLIKDLDVKGTSLIAKRGTAVRGITLVEDNAEQIEGRVNGQHIVILTKFVKKAT